MWLWKTRVVMFNIYMLEVSHNAHKTKYIYIIWSTTPETSIINTCHQSVSEMANKMSITYLWLSPVSYLCWLKRISIIYFFEMISNHIKTKTRFICLKPCLFVYQITDIVIVLDKIRLHVTNKFSLTQPNRKWKWYFVKQIHHLEGTTYLMVE